MNPYEPLPGGPAVATADEAAPLPNWEVWGVVGRSWRRFLRHPMLCSGLVVLIMAGVVVPWLLISLPPLMATLAAGGEPEEDPAQLVVFDVVTILVQPLLLGLSTGVWLQVAAGRPLQLGAGIVALRSVPRLLVVTAILSSPGLAWDLASVALQDVRVEGLPLPLASVGFTLAAAGGLLGVLGLQFTPFFVVDRGLGPVEALAAAWRGARGCRLRLLGLTLVMQPLAMAGACACGVGTVFAAAVATIACALVYLIAIRPEWERAEAGQGIAAEA